MNVLWWASAALVAWWLFSPAAPQGAWPPPPSVANPKAPLNDYIVQLEALQHQMLDRLRGEYPRERVRQLTLDIAGRVGVPAEWVWGVMARETGFTWRPQGLFGASAAAAIARGSSAFGMGQMVRSTFEGEARLNPDITWTHAALIQPEYSILTTALSLRRLIAKHGPNPPLITIGTWWAGKDRPEGAARKAADVATYGPLVHVSA